MPDHYLVYILWFVQIHSHEQTTGCKEKTPGKKKSITRSKQTAGIDLRHFLREDTYWIWSVVHHID